MIVLLDKVVVNGLCVMVSEEQNSDEVEGPEDRQAAVDYGGIGINLAKYVVFPKSVDSLLCRRIGVFPFHQ